MWQRPCRSLLGVDPDLLLLGIHYVAVAVAYLVFEMVPINYRPIPIDGVMEASCPSLTTLLVLGVMPTLAYQAARRMKDGLAKGAVVASVAPSSALMVAGRLVAGVHWATDIVGSILLASGLFMRDVSCSARAASRRSLGVWWASCSAIPGSTSWA